LDPFSTEYLSFSQENEMAEGVGFEAKATRFVFVRGRAG
jgi:hypothetical protein